MVVSLNKTKNLGLIKNILQKNDLPYEDIESKNIDFFLAFEGLIFIGIIGLENCNKAALLRSMVVNEPFRNKGYGKEICKLLINYAENKKIEALYLLTCTAKSFFEKIGFGVIDRNSAPIEIKKTKEFSSLCPSTTVCMKKAL